MIDDREDVLAVVKGIGGADCATDAHGGTTLALTNDYLAVYCDVHGIQKDGYTADFVVSACQMRGTPVTITTNDPLSAQRYAARNIPTVSKMKMYGELLKIKREAEATS